MVETLQEVVQGIFLGVLGLIGVAVGVIIAVAIVLMIVNGSKAIKGKE
jgi:hypothetical protein